MSDSPLKSPFRATLEATAQGLGVLVQILRDEQAALSGSDAQTLETCVQRKLEQLQQLEHSVMAREQILQQADCNSGLQGSEQFIREHFTPDEILALWKKVQHLSSEVDELNAHNGKLAMAGERATRQALSILTGRQSANDTYGRQGQDGSLSRLSLGKA